MRITSRWHLDSEWITSHLHFQELLGSSMHFVKMLCYDVDSPKAPNAHKGAPHHKYCAFKCAGSMIICVRLFFFFVHKKSSISFIARLKKKKRKKKERKFLPNLNKLMQKCVFILVHESLSLSLSIYIYILKFTYSLFKIPFIFIPYFIKTSKFLIFLFFFDTQQLLFALFLHSHNKA